MAKYHLQAKEVSSSNSSQVYSRQSRYLAYMTVTDNSEDIARVSCRDSGVDPLHVVPTDFKKTMLDASLGEILVTCEKLRWLIANGENVLKPEKRAVTGLLMMHKKAEIRYEPLGIVAALVSWNYPVHLCFQHANGSSIT